MKFKIGDRVIIGPDNGGYVIPSGIRTIVVEILPAAYGRDELYECIIPGVYGNHCLSFFARELQLDRCYDSAVLKAIRGEP